jgi:prepilin-type N-terminal cleavage/methylation domain-containing protein
MAVRSRIWRQLRRESGFSLVELLISIVVLSMAVGGLLALVEGSRASATTSEKRELAANLGEKEIERLEALSYGALALASTPVASADPQDPNSFVSVCGSPASACYRWDQSGSAPADPLVIDAANGDSTPNPQAASVAAPNGGQRISAQIYRYVTWVDDPSCSTSRCAGSTDYKRITVVVTVTGGPKKTILSSIVPNTAGGIENPLKNGPTTQCTDGATVVPCVQ